MSRSDRRIITAERETASRSARLVAAPREICRPLARSRARRGFDDDATSLSMDFRQRLAELSSAVWTKMVAAKGPTVGVNA